jgi:hypothetical protein
MLEKITGYTAMMEMLKNTKVNTAGSRKLVRRTGKMEESMMVMRKTVFTKSIGAQPSVIFFEALRHRLQTYRKK